MLLMPPQIFTRYAVVLLGALLVAASASAQTQAPPLSTEPGQPQTESGAPAGESWLKGRFALHVNGGFQSGSRTFAETFGYPAYGESAQFQVTHDIKGAGFFDAGARLTVWRDLSVGASFSQMDTSNSVTVTGAVPHPLQFNTPRTLPTQTLSVPHRERAVHVLAAWTIAVPDIPGLDIAIVGGPTFFNLLQGVVTQVTVTEAGGPPFTSVNLDQLQTGSHARNGIGGHIGVDLTYMPTTVVGVGFLARFTGGSVDLPTASGGTQSLGVGGFQVGGGVRFRF